MLTYLDMLCQSEVMAMKIDELISIAREQYPQENIPTIEILKDESVLLQKENLAWKKNFNYQGIYILCNDQDEVMYIGSAYVQTVHERLLQYTSSKDTGNSLIEDIKAMGFASDIQTAMEYIKNLRIYAFKNDSLEYKLIRKADIGIVNKVGVHDKN